MSIRAVVFADRDLGVRCLEVLLAQGVDVPLVLGHSDDAGEAVGSGGVAEAARLRDIPIMAPNDPNAHGPLETIRRLNPDFLFSFGYRRLLSPEMLALPRRAAYNMHGSLLPKYRGRMPVNWAVIRGETETGATLHRMIDEPDAGEIVARQAVPILPNDTALQVLLKVTVAAELALHRVLPDLIAGSAVHIPQNPAHGSRFGRCTQEDRIIDWSAGAAAIHNLVRGLAPPWPGACTSIAGASVRVLCTMLEAHRRDVHAAPFLFVDADRCYAQCVDGSILRIVALEVDGRALAPEDVEDRFGRSPIPLQIR